MKHHNDQTYTCVAPEIGELLFQYELGKLSDSERTTFEQHLMDCDFCLAEASQMRNVADALVANRVRIVESFEQEGLTVEALLERADSKPNLHSAGGRIELPQKTRLFSWESLFGPKAAIGFAASAAFILVIGLNLFNGNKPSVVGEYDPPVWLEWQTRGTTTPDSLLLSAQKSYSAQDYTQAANSLTKYVSGHDDAQASLYLGISRYELGQLELADLALRKVKTDNSVLRSETNFYRALIKVSQGSEDEAVNILKQVVAENSNRVDEARELMKRLGAFSD